MLQAEKLKDQEETKAQRIIENQKRAKRLTRIYKITKSVCCDVIRLALKKQKPMK